MYKKYTKFATPVLAALALAVAIFALVQDDGAAPAEQPQARGTTHFGSLATNGTLSVVGAADAEQLSVTGFTTQTSNLAVFENSAGVDLATISGAGATMLTGTLDVRGSVSDGAGALTLADNTIVDGAADAVQLTVQGYTTQTNYLFVVEQSDGTDVWRTNNVGQSSSANGAVSFVDDVIVDGAEDTDQLTVQGYTTQTNDLQVWEQSDGTDVGTMTNAGALDIASTVNYGTDNLYPLGQYGAAFGVLVGCGASVGAGLDQLDYVGGLSHGIGWGMVVGGVAVGARVVCDLGLSDLVLDVLNLRRKDDGAPQAPGANRASGASGEKGLWIWDARGGEGKMLLPDLPQAQVLKMAQRTAVAYMTGRTKKHFSQDHLGKSWGAYLNDAKKVLAALGHIKLGANKTYTFTESGVEWLQGVID